jgi:bifunctional non-homologous end joining protein LigD
MRNWQPASRSALSGKTAFILPSFPALRNVPPKGPGWLHEIKFDGYRVQLHKVGKDVVVFSRRGADFTKRYTPIAEALIKLPTRSAIIDAELVVALPNGVPDFTALHSGKFDPEALCAWGFDLLEHNGKDLRELPLVARKTILGSLLRRYNHVALRYSESFIDAIMLLQQAELHGLEGIVSKKREAPYRSEKGDWIKIKTAAWREANKNRGDLFGETR